MKILGQHGRRKILAQKKREMEEERERDVKGETPKFLIIGKYFGSEALNHMSLISEKANLL